jgi:hypothetical protein
MSDFADRLAPQSVPVPPITTARRAGAARVVADVQRTLAGPGRPLDGPTRHELGPRYGEDFSHVRVHSDDAAARSARGLGAAAYTVGSQIVLGAAQPSTATPGGQRLLAHELAHVVQQGRRRAQPVSVGPIGGDREARAEQAAAGRPVNLGSVPAGTIQRSPLSDRVRATAGTSPTLTSVLAALSGDDVQVKDPDLDLAISQMLGGRPGDVALAQQVRQRELGKTAGWAGPAKPKRKGSKKQQSITVRYVAGRTARRALVIAGVHGEEVQGVEVANMLLDDLAKAQNQPEMSAVIVPTLFPDDADYRDREGPGAHPNRNFPDPSKDLAASGGKDFLDKPIRRENVMLMELVERFAPERIISIHGTWKPSLAGVSYDPRTLSAGEEASVQSWGVAPDSNEANAPPGLVQARRAAALKGAGERDDALALGAADLIDTKTSADPTKGPARTGLKHPSVAGNFKGNSAKPNYAHWEGGGEPGVSLGGYASKRAISIFTVEPPEDKALDEFKGGARAAREFELKAYAEAVRTVLLGS